MALTGNVKGALLMVGSMAAFTLNDTLMKSLAGELLLPQAIFVRGVMTSALLFGLAMAMGQLRFRVSTEDGWLLGVRTLTEIAAVFLFLTALFNMPISNATAILQVLPLTVTLAAAIFLGEPIGWRRISAILVGFFGVLMIVRPGTDGFTIHSLYVLGAVAAVTLRDLTVRRMSGALPSLTVALWSAVGVTLCSGIVAAFQPWTSIAAPQGVVLVAAAGCILAAYTSSVMVMRVGDIAVVSLFRFSAILFALLLGVTVFGERPDGLTLAGAALVVASGVYALWRERLRGARAPRKPVVDTGSDSL